MQYFKSTEKTQFEINFTIALRIKKNNLEKTIALRIQERQTSKSAQKVHFKMKTKLSAFDGPTQHYTIEEDLCRHV